jgi:hypothetical protein
MVGPWSNAKNFSRSAHQEIIDQVNYLDNLQGLDPVQVLATTTGKTIGGDFLPSRFISLIGVIIHPENTDYQYTDPRYRVRILVINDGTAPEDLIKLVKEDDYSNEPEGGTDPSSSPGSAASGFTVTATHLAEITDYTTGDGSHNLAEDSSIVVQLCGVYDRIPGPNGVDKVRWFFTRGGGGGVNAMNNDTTIVSQTPFINIKGNGTQNVMQFVADTVSGQAGADQQFVAGTANYQTFIWNSGNWTIDYVRAHA